SGGTTFSGGFKENVAGASLTLAGTNTVLLPVSSSYTGGTTISGTTVMIGSPTALGATAGTINLVSGTIIAGAGSAIGQPLSSTGTTVANPLQLSGTAFTFTGSAPLTFSGPVTLTNNDSLTVNNATTFSGVIGEFGGPKSLTMTTSTGTIT